MNSITGITSPTVVILTLLGAGVAGAPMAGAHEPAPAPTVPTTSSPWAEPEAALGGLTLAAYVARHVERVLGPFHV
jgi:hypothetical protein